MFVTGVIWVVILLSLRIGNSNGSTPSSLTNTTEKNNTEVTSFCNWGSDGTGASSVCEGGAQGGKYCNGGLHRCQDDCGGRWCTPCEDGKWCPSELPSLSPDKNENDGNVDNNTTKNQTTTSINGGFCNWGPDGTAASSTCDGGMQGTPWCNETPDNCEKHCSGRWCLEEGHTRAPTPPPSEPRPGFCNYGPNGDAESSTCEGGPEGSDWCNESWDACETHCGGRWCFTDESVAPTISPLIR